MYSGEEARFVHRRMPRLLVRTAKFQRKPHVESHIATSNYCLAPNLNQCRCQHLPGFHHDHAKGSETPKTAYYPEAMARTISEMSLPRARFLNASDCYRWVKKNKKSHSKVWGMAAKFLKKSSHEPNLQDKSSVYTGIHLLFGRKDSHNHPGWKEAINKERDELLSRKEPTHVGIDWRQICQLNRTLGE